MDEMRVGRAAVAAAAESLLEATSASRALDSVKDPRISPRITTIKDDEEKGVAGDTHREAKQGLKKKRKKTTMMMQSAADVLVDDGGEGGLGDGADDALLLLAVLEHEDGGDAPDALVAMFGESSVFTLQHLILPTYSLASSSITGAIILHGPHHGAQNSTSTGASLPSTMLSQFFSSATTTATTPHAHIRWFSF
uniref:Uncharacterized protein n=1 Tax=Oryza nivara TaxID=4536 RepID=A0A0E0J7K2_ORYNI